MIAQMAVVFLFVAALATSQETYSYDRAGRLIEVHYPNGSIVRYSYDKAGNRLSTTVSTAAGNGTSSAARSKKRPDRKARGK